MQIGNNNIEVNENDQVFQGEYIVVYKNFWLEDTSKRSGVVYKKDGSPLFSFKTLYVMSTRRMYQGEKLPAGECLRIGTSEKGKVEYALMNDKLEIVTNWYGAIFEKNNLCGKDVYSVVTNGAVGLLDAKTFKEIVPPKYTAIQAKKELEKIVEKEQGVSL